MTAQEDVVHYSLHPLAEGIYAAIARDGGAAICNAGLIDLGESTLVVDAFLTPSAAENLRLDALQLTGRFPDRVINTHYHNDHIWGNQAFLPEAEIISTIRTNELIQTEGRKEYEEYCAISTDRLKELLERQSRASTAEDAAGLELWIGYYRGLVKDLPRLNVVLPEVLFENHLAIHGSRRRAELVAFTGAHTGSDVVVSLQEEGVVFMGDLLFVGCHPYLADGDPDRLLAAIRSILDGSAGIREAECFIPGHGPVGTREDLRLLAAYIEDCGKLARQLIDSGCCGPEYIEAYPVPAAYTDWSMPRFFRSNLRFLIEKKKSTGL